MIKKWFARTTPFVLLSVFAIIILLYQLITEGGGPDGWRYPLLLKLFCFILVIILADALLKNFISKTYLIWVVEVVLSLGLIYYWIVT